jgi:hypothetical protein
MAACHRWEDDHVPRRTGRGRAALGVIAASTGFALAPSLRHPRDLPGGQHQDRRQPGRQH